jgi:hypothetical protein
MRRRVGGLCLGFLSWWTGLRFERASARRNPAVFPLHYRPCYCAALPRQHRLQCVS